MAIKRGSKVDKSFFVGFDDRPDLPVAAVHADRYDAHQPQCHQADSAEKFESVKDKAMTTISIQDTGHGYRYYVETENVGSREGVEKALNPG